MRLFLLLFAFVTQVFCHDRLHCQPTQSFSAELISGEFKSPGFPLKYVDNLNCVYNIEPLENWGVALNIEYFSVEAAHDTVEIYQTYNVGDKLQMTKHAVLSGTNLPQTQFFSQINGGLKIHFKSDLSDSKYPGFKMTFNRFTETNGYHGFDPCPEIYHLVQSEEEQLPTFKWRFSPRSSCVFQLNSSESVELQINKISANLKIDVYETENYGSFGTATNPIMSVDTYKTSNFPQSVVSRTGSFTVVVSMMSTISDFRNAYNITYQQVPNPCKCPDNVIYVNTTETIYTSPGYPLEYCDNLQCVTEFKKAPGLRKVAGQTQRLQLQFDSFKVEAIHDLFELYSKGEKLKLLTPYDEQVPNMIEYFTFPGVDGSIVNFTTDATVVTEGFKLFVKVVNQPKDCSCPSTNINEVSGSFDFQLPAECGYIDCFWTFNAPESESSRYRFGITTSFDLGSWSEFIEISGDNNIAPYLSTYRLTSSMINSNETLTRRFIGLHSDQDVKLWYHREDENPKDTPNPNGRKFRFEYKWEERCVCGPSELIATEEWTLFQSPDYPLPYCDFMNCTYVITGPEDMIIDVNITFIDLEYTMDTLSFFDGPSSNYSRLDLFTGIEYMSDPIESSSNQMAMLFSSDGSVSSKGYQGYFRARRLKYDYPQSSRTSVFKVFLFLAFIGLTAFGGVYLFKRYQLKTGLTLPSFPSFQLNNFDSERLTSSINSLIRSNNDMEH